MKKCPHGVYDPHGDGHYCQTCNPGLNVNPTDAPKKAPIVFNRHGALTLSATGRLPKCPNCKGASILAVSEGGKCANCGQTYEIKSPGKLRANNTQPGICPECGCGVHIVLSAKTWKCADCDVEYRAPKRK